MYGITTVVVAGLGIIAFVIAIFMIKDRLGSRQFSSTSESTSPIVRTPTPASNLGAPSLSTPDSVEVLRYYLELEPSDDGLVHATDSEPLRSKRGFRIHFTPRKDGYIYIIGLGEEKALMTFLTSQPLPDSSVTPNRVSAGIDFEFPGNPDWLEILDKEDVTPFTIVFSTSPLDGELSFLAGPAERTVNKEQESVLEGLRKKFEASITRGDIKGSNHPAVTICERGQRPENGLLVFDISIRRKL